MYAALVSLNNEREPSPDAIGLQGTGAETISQNSLSRSTRFSGALPAMIAAFTAPIEIPAIHSGLKPQWQSA